MIVSSSVLSVSPHATQVFVNVMDYGDDSSASLSDGEFEIERILAERQLTDSERETVQTHWLVKWKGYEDLHE